MKKTIIFGLTLALAASVMITSCKDDFTEKDALSEQQTIDLSILAFDPDAGTPVPAAWVTIVRNGKSDSLQTNSQGIAIFSNTDIGTTIPLYVKAPGYTTYKTTINTTVNNYRQKLIAQTISIYPTTGASTAIIRGKVEIETDLTNNLSERAPQGTVIFATANTSALEEISASTTIDANGNYSITVPATKSGLSYRLTFPDLELDQKIGINGFIGDADFPIVVPTVQTLKTVLNYSTGASGLPGSTVPSVYAVIDADPSGTDAKKATLSPNISGGKITSISVNNGGKGYAASSTTVPVKIVALTTGSGATATANTDGNGTITSINAITGTAQGSGYSTSGANYNGNETSSITINVNTVRSGEIRVVNQDYGTGVLRAKEVK